MSTEDTKVTKPVNIQLAEDLRQLADIYENIPEIPMPDYFFVHIFEDNDKAKIIARAIAKAFPKVAKKMDDYYLTLEVVLQRLKVKYEFSRENICTLVTPAKKAVWECEPLLKVNEDNVNDSSES